MRISDWSSDVCSSDLVRFVEHAQWASPAHRNRSVPAGAAFAIASLIRFAHRLARETRALGAVEFAMTAPFLILLYVGGFQLMDAISAYRKVTDTTRSLADLTSRQETMTDAKEIERAPCRARVCQSG